MGLAAQWLNSTGPVAVPRPLFLSLLGRLSQGQALRILGDLVPGISVNDALEVYNVCWTKAHPGKAPGAGERAGDKTGT